MPIAICRLCPIDDPRREVISKIISKDFTVMSTALGGEMLNHMTTYHQLQFGDMVNHCKLFNGFLVMNQFELNSPEMNEDIEKMRNLFVDKVMEYSPEDNEDNDNEDDLEGLEEEEEERLLEDLQNARDLLLQASTLTQEEGDSELSRQCVACVANLDEQISDMTEGDEDEDVSKKEDDSGEIIEIKLG